MRLKDKVSLITGAARGLGRMFALTFAREGSEIIIDDLNMNQAEDVANEVRRMGRRATVVKADVSKRDQVSKLVDEAMEEFGRIDILVNNAGILWRTAMNSRLTASKEEWENVLGVNLLGTYYCIQTIAPYMIKQKYGKIINITSVGAIGTARTLQDAYAASKAGVVILTKKLAHELGPHNINVNAIAPGIIRTQIYDTYERSDRELSKYFSLSAKLSALRRIGEPQDVANVALFLASEESSFITGQVIVVDGGRFDFYSHSV